VLRIFIIEAIGPPIPHSKNNGCAVNKTDMVLIKLAQVVKFPDDTEVSYMLPFVSEENFEHLNALTSFQDLVNNHNFLDKLERENTEKKILDVIRKYEFLARIGQKTFKGALMVSFIFLLF